MGQLGGGNSLTRSFLDYKPLFLIRKAKIVRKRGKIRDWGAFQPIISIGTQIFPFLIVLIRIFSHFGYTSPHLSNSLLASNLFSEPYCIIFEPLKITQNLKKSNTLQIMGLCCFSGSVLGIPIPCTRKVSARGSSLFKTVTKLWRLYAFVLPRLYGCRTEQKMAPQGSFLPHRFTIFQYQPLFSSTFCSFP